MRGARFLGLQRRVGGVGLRPPQRGLKSIPYGELTIGVPKETTPLERRVAQTPDSIKNLLKAGFKEVRVEKGAGAAASFSDAAYAAAGAKLVSKDDAYKSSLITKVNPPTSEEAKLVEDRMLMSFLWPAQNPELMEQLQAQKATAIAMDCIPRTLSRGQAFDALSSQANIQGYRAVVEAANVYGRFFAGQMTAAGKVPPTKVLVLGGGVAGLAAVQTAKNMGAVVKLFDVRAAVKEQAKSLGAEFLEVDFEESGEGGGGYAKEMSAEWHAAANAMLKKEMETIDIVITTAQIPGKPAPKLVHEDMVAVLKSGSVVVDLAASSGGNCSATVRASRPAPPRAPPAPPAPPGAARSPAPPVPPRARPRCPLASPAARPRPPALRPRPRLTRVAPPRPRARRGRTRRT
jgi:NAD(P) transhydrogenase